MKLLKPTKIISKLENIDINYLKEKNYKLIILDYNNTIIGYYNHEITNSMKNYIKKLKENNIKLYILTNSFNKNEVDKVAKLLNIKYKNMAFKPFPFTLKRILKNEKISSKNTLIIGDHILTDVLLANLCKASSILVEPIDNNEKFHSKIVRKIEKIIISRF